MPPRPTSENVAARRVRLRGWRHPAILSVALFAFAAGFGQFGVAAALADVALAFGEAGGGPSLAEEVGLSLSTLGIGLAVIRFASLGSLPLTALADRVGRRQMILACCLTGLALTVLAAGSPTFWWFVAAFAVARMLLSATNALAVVLAAEETRVADRAKAVALVGAAYGVGAGTIALIRGLWSLDFRSLFTLAAVPFVLVALAGRLIEESDRYARLRQLDSTVPVRPKLGRVPARLCGRLAMISGLGFTFAFVQAPATTLVFLYAESVLGFTKLTTAVILLAGAGPAGLAGLLTGRWAADQLGRLPTMAVAHAAVAIAAAVTYTTGAAGAIAGYLGSLFAQSAYGPAFGALGTELFPTSIRGTSAGWMSAAGVLGAVGGLLVFGLLTDTFGSFGPAAVAVAVPVALTSAGYLLLPETRGLELEESAPEA